MPLHVPNAAHGLHLGLGGPEVTAVLVIALLQQVLQPAVAGVLVADPPAGPEVGGGHGGSQAQKERETRGWLTQQEGWASHSSLTTWMLSRAPPPFPGPASAFFLPWMQSSLPPELTIFLSFFFNGPFLKSLFNLL